MRIAVVGVGSLGTVVGALLSKAGLDVTLVDADRVQVDALNSRGANITGLLELTQPVVAVTPDRMTGGYDLVIYLVKSTYDAVALPQMLPHLDSKSALITLQNGVPEEKVASYIGRERTLGGAVGWAAELVQPGVSRLTSDPAQMTYDIGELDGAVTERIERVKSVLDHAGIANVSDNLTGTRWTKLMFNVAASGVSAALGATAGELMESDKACDAIILIMVESVLTAQALGIKMEPMRSADPAILLEIARADIKNARGLLRALTADMRDAKASMLQDLEKGLPCEVDSLNGYLGDMAGRAGVAAPVNQQITGIIRAIQEGSLSCAFSNLDRVELPPLASYFPQEEGD
jgi:2-dehydropantoate 2-reductase